MYLYILTTLQFFNSLLGREFYFYSTWEESNSLLPLIAASVNEKEGTAQD